VTSDPALARDAAHAAVLARRHDSVTTPALLAGLADLIPPPPARPCWMWARAAGGSAFTAEAGRDAQLCAADPATEITRAARVGLTLIRRHEAPPHNPETAAAGISWTWLALAKDGAR